MTFDIIVTATCLGTFSITVVATRAVTLDIGATSVIPLTVSPGTIITAVCFGGVLIPKVAISVTVVIVSIIVPPIFRFNSVILPLSRSVAVSVIVVLVTVKLPIHCHRSLPGKLVVAFPFIIVVLVLGVSHFSAL